MDSPVDILRKYWGHSAFRPLQEDIILSVLSGQDTLGLLPTGGGKSICFQVPGLMLGGTTLVVSPLIALMKDQVENLNKRGIPAAMLSSSQTQDEQQQVLELSRKGQLRFLYCAPERFRSEAFYQQIRQIKAGLLAIDEAHCISQWGYDFRPAYVELASVREMLPGIPCIALTASATPEVVTDIVQKLRFRNPHIVKGSFLRSNLRYFVLKESRREEKMLEVIRKIGGSGIVYARSRKGTQALADYLNAAGISAMAYHAGLSAEARNTIQQDWIENRTQAIAATNAFGMGIDKPDVRWVIHLSPPPDMESYYQEAGRGGRDGKNAFAVMITSDEIHHDLLRRYSVAFPSWENIMRLAQYLWVQGSLQQSALLEWNPAMVSEKLQISGVQLSRALNVLEKEGYIRVQAADPEKGALIFKASPDEIRSAMDKRSDADLIELLLRELGGKAFREYAEADLRKWAGKMKCSIPELVAGLRKLKGSGYLDFKWSGELPSVYLESSVPPVQQESVHWKTHLRLNAMGMERLQFMLQYADSKDECRTSMICGYFGEKNLPPCGVCDVCSGRHSDEIKQEMLDRLHKELVDLIPAEGIHLNILSGNIRSLHPGVRIKALRILAEKGILRIVGQMVFSAGK